MNGPLDCQVCGDWAGVRHALHDAGFVQERLAKTLAVRSTVERMDSQLVWRRVLGDSPYEILVRLFLLGHSCTVAELARVRGLDIGLLSRAGLLVATADGVRSQVRLAPIKSLYLASDFGPEVRGDIAGDHVVGVGAASLTLAGIAPTSEADSTLDLGTGAGIQAFLAAPNSQHVVATDLCERALNLARFNAALNGIANVDWRQGSLFDPVEGQAFDRIVCNPPFVISPSKEFIYRDGGCDGDGVSQAIIERIGPYLKLGGYATILFNWGHASDEDWERRPREWCAGQGCDAWLMRYETSCPLTYASEWLRSDGLHDAAYAAALDDWLAYYQRLGIEQISAGAIVLRKTDCEPWFRADSFDGRGHIGDCGEQVEVIFENEAYLAGLECREALLDACLLVRGKPELRHIMRIEDGTWAVVDQALRQTAGLTFEASIDVYLSTFLARCDGRTPMSELVALLATQLGVAPEQVASPCLEQVVGFLRTGLLRVGAVKNRDCILA